jgi:DNA-binding transcriptional ArsR family regulator
VIDRDEREGRAGVVFEALADPTRRAVLRSVAEHGSRTATEVADALPVSRQAVAKHLSVLRDAGLVQGERQGREVRFRASAAPLEDAGRWLLATGAAWDDRLQRLEARARRPRPSSDDGGPERGRRPPVG